MGKYERRDIELMEISVANVLMGKPPLIRKGHKWYKHMVGFVDYIRLKYPNFKSVKYTGNKYGSQLGDIKVTKASGQDEFLELKASGTASGRGTLANITQDAITKYQLIYNKTGGNILSWSKYRERKNFKQKVNNLLNEYQYASQYSFKDKGKITKYTKSFSFEDKGEIIRKLSERGGTKAINIRKRIMAFAKRNKKDYINYIRKFKTNQDNLIKFIFCMVNGIHTIKEIFEFFKKANLDRLKNIYGKVVTLYANVSGGKIIITRGKGRMAELLSKSQNFEFSFPSESGEIVNTYIVGVDKETNNKKRLLCLVYHWKNIFQGIKTPCINVFLGPDYQSI